MATVNPNSKPPSRAYRPDRHLPIRCETEGVPAERRLRRAQATREELFVERLVDRDVADAQPGHVSGPGPAGEDAQSAHGPERGPGRGRRVPRGALSLRGHVVVQ